MIEPLLQKLDGVMETGNRHWRAKCPAHESRGRSLSLSEAEDGRILMHCFAGCDSASVVAAIGMSLSDLFPAGGKACGKPTRGAFSHEAALALDTLERESLIVCMGLLQKRPLSEADEERMLVAAQRIREVRKLIRKNRTTEHHRALQVLRAPSFQ